MVSPHILALEDDPVLAGHLVEHLQSQGYLVTLSQDRLEGVRLAQTCDFDLILMAIKLPGSTGFEALRQLRLSLSVPIMLMSAWGGEQERIAGYSEGADDYLPKPFSLRELSVRIKALLRRVAYERQPLVQSEDEELLRFDAGRKDVEYHGSWAGLTPSEFRVLMLLWRHCGETLRKPFLYQHALHRTCATHDRSLDMHVSHIRRKLKKLGYEQVRLETVWGEGYVLIKES